MVLGSGPTTTPFVGSPFFLCRVSRTHGKMDVGVQGKMVQVASSAYLKQSGPLG